MCMRPEEYEEVRFNVNAAGQIFKETNKSVCFGGCTSYVPDLSVEIARRTKRAWLCYRKYGCHLNDQFKVDLNFKARILKAEVDENL